MLFSLLFLLNLQVSAQSLCSGLFTQSFDLSNSLRDTLEAENPDLRIKVESFLNDKRIPISLKKFLWNVLKTDQVQVHNFSPAVKKEYGFSNSLEAFVHDSASPYKSIEQSSQNLNDNLESPFKKLKTSYPLSHRRFILFVNDLSSTPTNHSLLDFIHEVAHVRMNLFLQKNLHRFVGRFPHDFLSIDPLNGEIHVNSHFINYLHERYAFETELKAYLALRFYPHLLGPATERWGGFSTSPESRIRLARQIRAGYKLKDERLAFLDRLPLNTIFQQGLDEKFWNFGK